MYVPRAVSPTDNQIPEQERASLCEPVARGPRDSFVVTSKPSFRRSNTPDFHMPAPEETRKAFESGTYANPARRRSSVLTIGMPILTDSHARLIDILREECARLHGYSRHVLSRSQETTNELAAVHVAWNEAKGQVQALRAQVGALTAINVALCKDLQIATDSLAEVDAMFLSVSKKRISRLNEVATHHAHDATAILAPQRPESPKKSLQTYRLSDPVIGPA